MDPRLSAESSGAFADFPARRGSLFAARMAQIEPFHVMNVMVRADALQAQGRSVAYMVLGEPDFSTAEPIVQAGVAALQAGKTHYAPDLGLPALRDAIARSYAPAIQVDPEQVVVTPGEAFDAPGYLRISYATSMEQLREGATRILRFAESLQPAKAAASR